MTFVGSNISSSNGAGSSRGPPPCGWVSLTLEEQLENFKRILGTHHSRPDLLDDIFKSVARVVKNLRKDPWIDIGSLMDDMGPSSLLSGSTPLHWAVLMDDRTMVRYILDSGRVDINAFASYLGVTALHYAVNGGNHDIVEDLLEHGADVCSCDRHGESALSDMVRQKDSMYGILKRILANNVNMCDANKNTALHCASKEGATDVVTYLLNEKADVNLHNHYGFTPLHYAAKKGALDVVTCLLQHNADVNALDDDWWSPLPFGGERRALDKFGLGPLHIAAKEGHLDIVTHLMEHNANVNAVVRKGWNLLLLSIRNQWVDIANNLIALGADVHVQDDWSNNALHLAIDAYGREHTMMDIVKYLRERNVDLNAKNSKGYSPFFVAVGEGHTEVVKELLQSKEKIKLMEECNGRSVIQIAFDNGHEHIKRALLECDDVSRYVGDLYRDRQVYVDAANAILVGAALIASVTFASWLQPPLGYTTPFLDLAPTSPDVNYVDVQHNVSLRAFWVFNTLSFYFAIGTVVFGARSVLPRRRMFIKDIVEKLHQNLLVTSILLACSVFFVIIAFGIAGCIVLTPTLKFQWYMIVPTIFGGLVCLVSLWFLFKSMVEDNLEQERETILYINL